MRLKNSRKFVSWFSACSQKREVKSPQPSEKVWGECTSLKIADLWSQMTAECGCSWSEHQISQSCVSHSYSYLAVPDILAKHPCKCFLEHFKCKLKINKSNKNKQAKLEHFFETVTLRRTIILLLSFLSFLFWLSSCFAQRCLFTCTLHSELG